MISIDDHPPPDPSSSHQNNQEISHDLNINSDGKAHAHAHHATLPVPDIDLIKSSVADLDETSDPLPNFSIRDYVFRSRSKDITCNWPFSLKNLQVCLRHGVKNLLPPFQPLDLLRDNSSFSRCSLEKSLPDEEILSSCDGKPTDDQFVSATTSDSDKLNQELALESVNTNPSKYKGEREFQSHPEEDSLPVKSNKTPPDPSQKTDNTNIQNPAKKCRLVVKLNSGVEPVEEITPSSFMVSETMASKVCPVCKTFSSSSNTTLNAHIDQCLSGESSMKWTANPKVMVKHRIKPRKSRLMVDIYKTAPHCTVEELDRRNGTSWATNSSFPTQELEFQAEEENEELRASAVTPAAADHEGAVYIDTDGTKVRILSVPKVGTSDDHGARKFLKAGKQNKIVTWKKKHKISEQKHCQKYLKLGPSSKKFCSPKPHHGSSEARSDREDDVAIQGSCNKEDRGKLPMKAQRHMKMDDLAITRPPWACSKRTGITKKFSGKDDKLRPRSNATSGSKVENEKSSLGCGLRTPSSSDKLISSSSPYREQPLLTNMEVESSSGSLVGNYAKKRSPLSTKPSSKHLRKEAKFLHESCKDPLNTCPSRRSEGSGIRPKGIKFSSLRKNLMQASQEPNPASKLKLKRKFCDLKESGVHCFSNINAVEGPSQDSSKQCARTEEETTEVVSFGKMDLLKTQKKGETKISQQEKSFAMKSSDGDSSVGIGTALVDALHNVESDGDDIRSHGDQVGIEPAPRAIDVQESFMALNNSLNPEFPKLVSQPDNNFDSQECMELYQGRLYSPKRTLDDKEMYCAGDIEKTVIGENIGDCTDDIEKQGNYFHEVDPIPIPGPPGSFLPSPGGDMVSEELQGNSSLTTTSRVQSSDDQHNHDMMDRDSLSDSPISTISNPSLARSDSRSSDKFSVRSTSLQDDIRPGFSGAVVDAVDAKSAPVTSSVNARDWRPANMTFMEKGPALSNFKNDQPCCCSRKEGASSQSVALNYQESAALKKQERALESNRRPSSLNVRPHMFAISNYPSSPAAKAEHETASFSPTMKSPADSVVKLPVYSDCDSAASPSCSQPVLRLMGKNLTVVKADEDVSSQQQFWSNSQLISMPRQHPSHQFCKLPNEDCSSFSLGYPSQHSVIFDQNQNGSQPRHLNVQPPNNFGSHFDFARSNAVEKMFPSSVGGFMAPLDSGHGFPHPGLTVPLVRAHLGHDRLHSQVRPRPERNVYNTSGKPSKEIIVIDDSPESEGEDPPMVEEGMRSRVPLSASVPFHMASRYGSSAGQVNGAVGSMVYAHGNFHATAAFGDVVNGNLGRWNCGLPGSSSGVLQPSSLASVLPPSHLRPSAVNYPPGFS